MGAAAPFADDVAQLVTQTHEQRVRLVAEVAGPDLDLDVSDYSIDWDETRTPRVQGSFDVAPPEDQATLDLLDPRTLVKVRLYAAYRLASGEFDEQQVAVLYLRYRRLRRVGTDVVLTLDLASSEAMFIDGTGPNPSAADSAGTWPSLVSAVTTYVTDVFAGTPLSSIGVVGTAVTPPVDLPMAPHPWDALSDAAEQYDVNIYDDGDELIRVTPRQYLASDAVLALSVGTNGTIVSSSSGVSRDDWANWVSVWYAWTDAAGASQWDGGYANVVSGPFAPAAAGYKIVTVERSMKGDAAAGNRLARTTLRRMLARARSYTIEALPAWWVRPERTVTLQLPLGAQERHLVSRVAFRPGVMTIETRLPDTASVIGE